MPIDTHYLVKSKVIFLLFFLFLLISCSTKNENTQPPNIIIFLVDDMGLMDTSVPFATDSNDNPVKYPLNDFYKTPHIEKLAKQGIRFTNFYAHSVCSPTRTSILTGQNSARHGVTNWIKSEENNKSEFGPENWNWLGLNSKSITLPRVLKAKGYKTIHVGKAHFGPIGSEGENPLNLGFDINIAGNSFGQPGSYYGVDGFGHIRKNKKRAVHGLEKYHGKEIFLSEALTIEANKVITQSKEENKPFFLYMSHYGVHSPFQSDPRFIDHYKDSEKPEKAIAFATMIEGIDHSLGSIVKQVKKLGLGENTLVLFLGDNGSDAPLTIQNDYSSSKPFKGKKGQHWEGGMRVPFIAAWITPNSNSDIQKQTPVFNNGIQNQIGTVMDIFPTLTKIAESTIPESHVLDGFKLQKQLKGTKNISRDESFLNHFPHQHRSSYFTSLVDGNWKIIYHYQVKNNPHYELFNLKNDPYEMHNIASKNQKQLHIMMKKLQQELKAKKALYPEKKGKIIELILP
tara:strand:+ start:3299 stop:4837 length:1539 start_codon:yes stop_codon:yes gene_type:complete